MDLLPALEVQAVRIKAAAVAAVPTAVAPNLAARVDPESLSLKSQTLTMQNSQAV